MTLDEALQVIELLRAENAALRRELQAVKERLAELEQAAARQAAPFRRPEQKKIPAEQKKPPGRKPGHPGAMRARPRRIDAEVEAPLPPRANSVAGIGETVSPWCNTSKKFRPFVRR